MNKRRYLNWTILSFAGLLLAGSAWLISYRGESRWHGDQKLIILGIDGMDPQLLKQFIQQGKMPNFYKLMQQGSFRQLTTSIPPQSPVAWSNLITGMNPDTPALFPSTPPHPKPMPPHFP